MHFLSCAPLYGGRWRRENHPSPFLSSNSLLLYSSSSARDFRDQSPGSRSQLFPASILTPVTGSQSQKLAPASFYTTPTGALLVAKLAEKMAHSQFCLTRFCPNFQPPNLNSLPQTLSQVRTPPTTHQKKSLHSEQLQWLEPNFQS